MTKKNKVLVTGVFDILHSEHILFLQKARQLGDYLVVALESDIRVKKIKGENRPINPENLRKKALESLNLADEVIILPEKFDDYADHKKFINQIKPNILAISSHTKHQDSKRKIIESCGGSLVVVHQHNPQISSTKILQKCAITNRGVVIKHVLK